MCKLHGGAAPQVLNKARLRADLMAFGLDAPPVDPAATLLRLVNQSAARVANYATDIANMVDDQPTLRSALTAEVWKTDDDDPDGEAYRAGEYIRAMVVLEGQERDRLAALCKSALQAGLAERQVRLAEQQGSLMAAVLRTALGDPRLALTADQRAGIPAVLRDALTGLMGARPAAQPARPAIEG